MVTFDLTAKSGLTNCSKEAREVCQTLESKLFPLDFKMVCKSPSNNYQLSSLFDDALQKKAPSVGLVPGTLKLPQHIAKEYDAVFRTEYGTVVVEVEKANWEKFLYDMLKAHIYLNHGADYCCIILPENWAHQHGEIDLFQESNARLDLAKTYHFGDPNVLDRLFLIGFRQFWNGQLLTQSLREQMRAECRRAFGH